MNFFAGPQVTWPQRVIVNDKQAPGDRRGLTPKKEHELVSFAATILSECHERGISHVVDVGSGVGHLVQYLARAGVPRITAIEGNAAHHNKAWHWGGGGGSTWFFVSFIKIGRN